MEFNTITKFSKNNKLNTVLTAIKDDLIEMGIDEVKRYFNEFKSEPDYNIVNYGNMLIYYDDIYKFYREAGYKSLDRVSNNKIWEIYRRQVGYVVGRLVNNY